MRQVQIVKTKTNVIGVVILGLAFFFYGASHRSSGVRSTESLSPASKESRSAPDFELKTVDGRAVKLSAFRGKAVVLNFWATYCGPCRVEMPWLIELYRQYQLQGLEIIGVSMDDPGEAQQVADFVREFGVNYTIVLGNHTVGDAYGGARFLPQTFFINREGRITGSATGMKSKADFEILIRELLANASHKFN